MTEEHRLDTRLIHAGEPRPRPQRAVAMPVYQSATFEYGGEDSYDAVRYLRLNNTPNHGALHGKLAALEGAEAALVTGSGMAAITTTLLATLRPGDHLIAQRCVYGGTHHFMTDTLAGLGITTTFVDGNDREAWAAARRETTRAFYVEAMTNPLLEVADLREAAAFASKHGLLSIIDATFATPILFRPVSIGFDVVLHSATKYLNGHSDITAGAIVGSASQVASIRHLLNHLGGTLDPHACFLLQRGFKTLGVRVGPPTPNVRRTRRHCSSMHQASVAPSRWSRCPPRRRTRGWIRRSGVGWGSPTGCCACRSGSKIPRT